jgi:alpha-beta hydrolase superfamily lysophospholipase
VVTLIGVGSVLVARSDRRVLPPPAYLQGESVTLASLSGEQLAAWVFVPRSPRAAVVVLHGVRANRSDMIGRAEMLWNAGFAVLTPDLQAHGDLARHDPSGYRDRVIGFLERHLTGSAAEGDSPLG